jgi:dihydrodipicolinate synthase/N-acetylneuraminate lyase
MTADLRLSPMSLGRRLSGAIAAAVTPLTDGGARLDEDAFRPYADYLVGAGLDGVLAFGTNGEAVLLSVEERRRGLELWLEAVAGRALVAAHCGAQTTSDTVALAAHARDADADAVAVIGPPYFKLDPREQLAHLLAAAQACAPLPFYVYEFAATAGYAFDPSMLARLREEADNVTGMKVSDTPWTAFERYLLDGFDVFVGPESLIHLGRAAGAVGAVSALASAFPEDVAAVVREPTEAGAARLASLRRRIESFPRHAALKRVVGRRGLPVRPDVRPPLRDLDDAERASLDAWLDEELGSAAA